MSRSAQAPAPPAVEADRPLRADARRNRDRLLATAAEVFDERGVDAPLEEIARRAGVGIGTLYRHLPTRDAVIEAVYRRELALLTDEARRVQAELAPDEALETWMRAFARYAARKRGMATALKTLLGADNELFAQSRESIRGAIGALVRSASEAGSIRSDADPDDVLGALSGICMATDAVGFEGRAARLCGLLMDGLRFGAVHSG